MHLYCIILEAFCNAEIYTFVCFFAFQTFGSALYIVLFVISAYLELNSHFGERCDVSGVVVQLKKQSTLNLYMNNIVFFFFFLT